MKIRCKLCGEYFYPDDETLGLMSDGFLNAGDVNTCDDCWDMLNQPCNDDLADMISDADPVL
jgi:hypothetical protein